MAIFVLVQRVCIYLHVSSQGPPQTKSTLGTENNNRNSNTHFSWVGTDLYIPMVLLGSSICWDVYDFQVILVHVCKRERDIHRGTILFNALVKKCANKKVLFCLNSIKSPWSKSRYLGLQNLSKSGMVATILSNIFLFLQKVLVFIIYSVALLLALFH